MVHKLQTIHILPMWFYYIWHKSKLSLYLTLCTILTTLAKGTCVKTTTAEGISSFIVHQLVYHFCQQMSPNVTSQCLEENIHFNLNFFCYSLKAISGSTVGFIYNSICPHVTLAFLAVKGLIKQNAMKTYGEMVVQFHTLLRHFMRVMFSFMHQPHYRWGKGPGTQWSESYVSPWAILNTRMKAFPCHSALSSVTTPTELSHLPLHTTYFNSYIEVIYMEAVRFMQACEVIRQARFTGYLTKHHQSTDVTESQATVIPCTNITVFCDLMQCSLVAHYQHLGGTCFIHLHVRRTWQ